MGRLMSAISSAYHAGLDTWRFGPTPSDIDTLRAAYLERWSLYSGTLFNDLHRRNPYRHDPAIYQNTRLLWKHAEAVVDFYAGIVYQGPLSPEPEQGAIPIRPETTSDERDKLLLKGIWELYGAWNWQQQMSLRSMYAAALGDSLTELVDNLDRRMVYPRHVWPGYVTDIELDDADNVRAYTLEYLVEERDDNGRTETYTYRKDVDGETFRYFKNDKAFDYGDGAIVPNPYGFVPAIWDRHRIGAQNEVRGRNAIGGTWQAVMEHSSILSHAFDHQRKVFFAPVMVAGAKGKGLRDDVNLGPPADDDEEPASLHGQGKARARALAQSFDVVKLPEGASLLQPQFDIGQTRAMLEDLRQGILDENPEAAFWMRIREMAQVTAPGVRAAQGDVGNRVDLVRNGADSQTKKLLQMALAIGGFRANDPVAWKRDRNGRAIPLDRRRMALLPFDLESFGRGELDFTIVYRELVPPAEVEVLEVIRQKQEIGIPLEILLEEELGYDEERIARVMDLRRQAADDRAALFNRGTVAPPIGDEE